MTSKKYFIAVLIPEPLFSEIESLKQSLYKQYGLKGALRSPAHITLHRPFEWKEEKEQILLEKLSQFSFKENFEISLQNFGFFEPRVIYVDVLSNKLLYDLHTDFVAFAKLELKLFNEADDLRGFHPHVTIAFRDLKKKLFYELQNIFASSNYDGQFKFTSITLLKLNTVWEPHFTFNK